MEREEKITEKRGSNAQVIPQYSRTEDAYGEEVTTQTSVSTENAGDCLVVVFFNVVSQSEPGPGEGKVWAPRRLLITVSRYDVPCCRIECYRPQGKEERCLGHVKEGTGRHAC